MENIKLDFDFSGNKIQAETTYVTPGEFGLKLIDPEFDASFETLHIPIMALGHRRFFNFNGSITEYGQQEGNEMASALYEGYQKAMSFKDELEKKASDLIQPVYMLQTACNNEIDKLNFKRNEFKKAFKNADMNAQDYSNRKREIETQKQELKVKYDDLISDMIDNGLSQVIPETVNTDKKCCGNYSANNAVRCFFKRMVNNKCNELIKNNKTK